MEYPWEFRNKTQLPTRHDGDKVVVGIYEKDSNRLVYIDKCLIESKLIQETMAKILDYLTKASINVYNPRFRQGNLKYIVLFHSFFPHSKEVGILIYPPLQLFLICHLHCFYRNLTIK